MNFRSRFIYNSKFPYALELIPYNGYQFYDKEYDEWPNFIQWCVKTFGNAANVRNVLTDAKWYNEEDIFQIRFKEEAHRNWVLMKWS